MLQATEAGLQAVGVATNEDHPGSRAPVQANAAQEAAAATPATPATSARLSAKFAAHAVLAAWDDTADGRSTLPDAIEALRTALSGRPASSRPRPDTKRATVLALLRRPEGATVAQWSTRPAGRGTPCAASSPA